MRGVEGEPEREARTAPRGREVLAGLLLVAGRGMAGARGRPYLCLWVLVQLIARAMAWPAAPVSALCVARSCMRYR